MNISAGSVEEYAEMAWRLDIEGVDAVEVNISCPNVKEGGIVFGTDPKAAAAVTHAVKTHTKKTKYEGGVGEYHLEFYHD